MRRSTTLIMTAFATAMLVLIGPAAANPNEPRRREARSQPTASGKSRKVWQPRNTKAWRDFLKLTEAVDRCDLKAVRTMVARGVDVNGRRAGDGFAPMDRPLMRAAKNGDELMTDLLLRAGADPDWCCCACVTALHLAIKNKHVRVVSRLLDAGASAEVLYDSQMSPLDLAKQVGSDEIVRMVRERLPRR
jgi:hypothetical protein